MSDIALSLVAAFAVTAGATRMHRPQIHPRLGRSLSSHKSADRPSPFRTCRSRCRSLGATSWLIVESATLAD